MIVRRAGLIAAMFVLIVATSSRANAACTSITTLPYTISASGNYCVANPIVYSPPAGYQSAILVNIPGSAANPRVVVDLGANEITCFGTNCNTANGVYSAGAGTGLTVQNGYLTGFHIGVYLYQGVGATVTNVQFYYSVQTNPIGIYADGSEVNTVVRGCYFNMNGGRGVELYNPGGVTIVDNDFRAGSYGIYVNEDSASNGVLITGNRFVGIAPLYVQALHGDIHSPLLFSGNIASNSSNAICVSNCSYYTSVNNTLY
jgi:parallel beta-helix repeat protein